MPTRIQPLGFSQFVCFGSWVLQSRCSCCFFSARLRLFDWGVVLGFPPWYLCSACLPLAFSCFTCFPSLPIYLCPCLSVVLCVRTSPCRYACQSLLCLSVLLCLFVSLSACLFWLVSVFLFSLSFSLSLSLASSVCPFVSLFVSQSVFLPVSLSASQSWFQSVFLSVRRFVCRSGSLVPPLSRERACSVG